MELLSIDQFLPVGSEVVRNLRIDPGAIGSSRPYRFLRAIWSLTDFWLTHNSWMVYYNSTTPSPR